MTTAPPPTTDGPGLPAAPPSLRDLATLGALVALAAAACTTAVAAIASAAGASLEVDGRAIPIPAFTWWTVIGTVLGVVLARLLRQRRRFVTVTTIATAVSLVPAVAAPDDGATRIALVATHLLAAAIVIPAVGRRLDGADASAR